MLTLSLTSKLWMIYIIILTHPIVSASLKIKAFRKSAKKVRKSQDKQENNYRVMLKPKSYLIKCVNSSKW